MDRDLSFKGRLLSTGSVQLPERAIAALEAALAVSQEAARPSA